MRRDKRAKPSQLVAIPKEEDWGDYKSDLDQNHAHTVFFGRTNEEMQRFFRQNPVEMTSELRWMPDLPFRYYMLGFRDFVVANDFDGHESDAASCFLGLILEKLEKQPLTILPIMQELFPTSEYVAKNQAEFDADIEIYGNFLDKLARIKAIYGKHRALP